MKKFQIEIEEILQKVVEVEAETLNEAIENVEEQYSNEEIVLDAEDFKEGSVGEYISEVREDDLDKIFETNTGEAIILEGDKHLALIKRLNIEDNPYVVVTDIKPNKYKTAFEWLNGTYFQNIKDAIYKYNELNELRESGILKNQNSILYSELGKVTLNNNYVEKFENIDEVFDFIFEDAILDDERMEQIPTSVKEDLCYYFAGEKLIKEGTEYYYGQDLCFFEDEINKKTMKISNIFDELHIENVKPYDIIELIERGNLDFIEPELKESISLSLKLAGYEKTVDEFVEYIDDELQKEVEIEDVEENEM